MSDCSNWRGDQIKATVEQEFRERRSEDSWSVRGRQPERMLRVIAETTERVDVFRTRRVRTCLSLSVNKINPSLHEPTLSASFLPYELCYTYASLTEGCTHGVRSWIWWREWRRASPYLLPHLPDPLPALWDRKPVLLSLPPRERAQCFSYLPPRKLMWRASSIDPLNPHSMRSY